MSDSHGLVTGDGPWRMPHGDVPVDEPRMDYEVCEVTDDGFKLKTASQCVTYDPSTIRVEWASDPAKASDDDRATRTLPPLKCTVEAVSLAETIDWLKARLASACAMPYRVLYPDAWRDHRGGQRSRRKVRAARKRRRGWA